MSIYIFNKLKDLTIEPLEILKLKDYYTNFLDLFNKVKNINYEFFDSKKLNFFENYKEKEDILYVFQINYKNQKWTIKRFIKDIDILFNYFNKYYKTEIKIVLKNNYEENLNLITDILNDLVKNTYINQSYSPLNDFLEFSIANVEDNNFIIYKQMYIDKVIGTNNDDNIIVKIFKNNVKLKRWFILTNIGIVYLLNSKVKIFKIREQNFYDSKMKLEIIKSNSIFIRNIFKN